MAEQQIGLNGQEATAALQKTENSYGKIMDELSDRMQDAVIKTISETWYGNDAIEFMRDKFKPAIDSAIKSVEDVFQSVNDTITQNASNFDNEHKTNVFQKVAHNIRASKINADLMKADKNSFIGITDSATFEGAKNILTTISDSVLSALKEAVQAAQNSGFYGGGQQEALVNSMNKIKDTLSQLTDELTQATQEKVNQTKAREEEIAKANANTFQA